MNDPNDAAREKMLALMEQTRDAVATYTGIKQQFINEGWSPLNAEAMVVAILRQGAGGAA